MIEIEEPELDVKELASVMREEAMSRKIAAPPGAMQRPAPSQPVGLGLSAVQAEPLALQPPFQPRADHRYHVRELLQYHDRNFIQNAYRAILKRGPDATGFRDFIEALRSGRLNKIDILARLRYSSEGRAKKVQVEGLFVPAVIRQSYRVPVLGYLFQLLVALARLPRTVRSQQQFEAHTLAQHEQLADYANATRSALANHAGEVSSALAALRATFESSLRRQQEQQAALDELRAGLGDLSRNISDLGRNVDARLAEILSEWRARDERLAQEMEAGRSSWQLLDARLAEEGAARNAQVGTLVRSLESETAQLRDELERASQLLREGTEHALERQQQLRAELVMHGQRVTRLLEEVTGGLRHAPLDQEQLQTLADEERHALDAFYVSFEDQFRGSRAQIKERLMVYLPLLEGAGIGTDERPILDIGSGRGEWLELLGERGLKASGVDLNRALAHACRERGLSVVEADVMRYLRSLPDESLGAVTGFHLVEHLPIETLVQLLDETVRVIKPGGACIFETPNPENVLVGSCNFYFDPTHRNPLPSPIMRFLLESRGFARVRVIELNPSDAERVAGDSDLVRRFNRYFYGPMDYAAVGWKV